MPRLTKEIAVVTTDLRAYEIIETFWEDYPFYLKVASPMTYINGFSEIDEAFTGDVIVWDKNEKFKTMKETTWNKIYGKYLKERLENKE